MDALRSVRYVLGFAFIVAGMLVVPRTAQAGPITFNTALPVHDDELIVREQVLWRRATDDPSPMGRNLNAVAVPSVLVYGAHPRVTLFGVLPFLHKRLELTTPMGRATRSTSGFGDMRAFVRGTAVQIDRPGETIRLAPFAGVKLPTGADDEADDLGRLPQPLQLGTGSWDPFGGVIFTWQTLRWELDASASYELRTEANDFDGGDIVRGDLSFQYRVLPWGELGSGVPNWLFAVLELNTIWQDENEIPAMGGGMRTNADSGGTKVFLAPGLQWITVRTVLEAAVQIPIVQELNGQALEDDFIARVSFRANF